MKLVQKGLEKGLIHFDEQQRFITYVHQNRRVSWSNLRERVHAETFLKLVLVYDYPVERIRYGVSVVIGDQVQETDMVVYRDDACREPYIVIKCNREEVSEQEFEQAVSRTCDYAFAASSTAKFIWVTSGIKNVYFEFDKLEGVRKYAPDIPTFGFDKPVRYKWVKGGEGIVSEEREPYVRQRFFELEKTTEDELTRRFKQAHDAL